jgi:CheY-like chemotaxis protein
MDGGSRSTAPVDPRAFRVLVVDDDESVRMFVERVLRQPGYDTTAAVDGFEAIQIAEARGPFDLLVTDVAMPGMQGDELARRLRRDDPALKVLYLTGYSDLLFRDRVSLWEEEAFLDKPVTVQGLLEAVSLILVGHVPSPRSVRVRIPGVRVRLANSVADLVNLSESGVLVHAVAEVPVGSSWPLALELPSATLRLSGRVVSCTLHEGVSPDDAAPRTPYAVALAFVEPSAAARDELQRVCRAPGATRNG